MAAVAERVSLPAIQQNQDLVTEVVKVPRKKATEVFEPLVDGDFLEATPL